MDPFVQLPMEILHTILSFLPTNEAARTNVLSKTFQKACSTNPSLRLSDLSFSNALTATYDRLDIDISRNQEAQKAKERFTTYIDRTLTRYQEHNVSIKRLDLHSCVDDDETARFFTQFICKAKDRVKEFHLQFLFFPFRNSSTTLLLQAIFALKDKLHILELVWCDFVKDIIVQDDGIINFSSLGTLKLTLVLIDQEDLQKLIHCCPFFKELEIFYCQGLERIQVANLSYLKWLHLGTYTNQMFDVNAANLETLIYEAISSPYFLNIESTTNFERTIFDLHQHHG